MTLNERAVKLCKEILYGDPDPRTVSSMAAAMTEAVTEERRINAQIARGYDQRWNPATCDAIAAAIMSRDVFTEPPPTANPPRQRTYKEWGERARIVVDSYRRMLARLTGDEDWYGVRSLQADAKELMKDWPG